MSEVDQDRPSLFELAAVEQLQDLLRPVSRYILSVFAQRHPPYLLRIFNKHDEVFAFAMFLIERHFLKTWNATFSEHFYSLKRRQHVLGGASSRSTTAAAALFQRSSALRRRDIWLSLLFRVGLPYLHVKAQNLYERVGGDIEADSLFADEPTAEDLSHLSRRERLAHQATAFFKKAYPYTNTAYQAAILLYSAAYMFHDAPFFRPWLHFMRIEIRRMSAQDLQRGGPTSAASSHNLVAKVQHAAFESLQYVIPGSIFLFKFVEWWNASTLRSSATTSFDTALPPALKPPNLTAPGQFQTEAGEDLRAGQCAVCRQQWVNPTAFTVSGAVACYACAWKWVNSQHCCPLTNKPATKHDLRKIVA